MAKIRTLLALVLLSMPFLLNSNTADAAFGGYGVCGTMCMAQGGGMMNPFYGTPFAQDPYAGYGQTGQMSYYDNLPQYNPMIMALNQQLNWGGASPMGAGSYMPPMGGAAIYNWQSYQQLEPYIRAGSGM